MGAVCERRGKGRGGRRGTAGARDGSVRDGDGRAGGDGTKGGARLGRGQEGMGGKSRGT